MSGPLQTPWLGGQTRSPQGPPRPHPPGRRHRYPFRLCGRASPRPLLAALVFATGLLDDIFGLKPWQKLLGQVAAAVLVFSAGVHFSGIGGYQFPIWWTLPATILWLVGCTNAFNLIDGVDGLAAGVGFFATLTTLMAALLQHNIPLALATAPLAAALLGFLRFNFNPATVFLGDCGSLLNGFLLGAMGCSGVRNPPPSSA